MRRPRAMPRDRRWWIAAVVGVLVLGGLVTAALKRDRRQAPVSVQREIEGFRGGDLGRMPPGSPPPGVYVYATQGFEDVGLLGGARHDYPRTTTVTVSPGGCGYLQRWVALAARSDEAELCPAAGGAWRLASETQVHEFYRRRDERTYRCEPGSLARPAEARAGTRFFARCAIRGTTEAMRGRVVARERVRIGGRTVAGVHLRVRTRVSGSTTGTGTADTWLRAADGLLLRAVVRNENATGTIAGTARYRERYALSLRSLAPRR